MSALQNKDSAEEVPSLCIVAFTGRCRVTRAVVTAEPRLIAGGVVL